MISRLDGTVLAARGQRLVVGVGGVGLAVAVTPQTSLTARAGSAVALHTHLIVREDELSLYGFETEAELDAFELLIGVTGVGPKSALGVLAHLTPDALARAVDAQDERAFKAVSGIGPKTAKLIILQLSGKLVAPVAAPATPGSDARADVLTALTGLGWPERTAADAIERAAVAAPEAAGTTGALLRAALAILGPGARP
ncbi:MULTISPECIES: Holliday junction branch migration protein RuvA [unclassified Agrococcus]|uniref:Holliday junction branch migration protein RuvA n=1 Tax=unclassified Agrococcus TaxID=2615065 RepID=UPI001FF2467F|nr:MULTISPECIES: Holliday junction branch migration protein RuvA [unclassified Agrococcus]MDR7234580.1 Holliday junction DNA helicase RuvA [Agrococcus sp. BE272]UOW00543.1 Holliday junction branch migration protein RuvA [Agrococcus sp. SCSIO52902]